MTALPTIATGVEPANLRGLRCETLNAVIVPVAIKQEPGTHRFNHWNGAVYRWHRGRIG